MNALLRAERRRASKGLSSAVQLSKVVPEGIVVVDSEPMGLTSSVSTGGFRNFYPDSKFMTQLCNRSIAMLDEIAARTENRIGLNRCGYVFISETPAMLQRYLDLSAKMSANGSGDVRRHDSVDGFDREGYAQRKDGVDIITDARIIHALLPHITPSAVLMMHVRNAGFMNVKGLGEYLLEEAQRNNVHFVRGLVRAYDLAPEEDGGQRFRSVRVTRSDGEEMEIRAKAVVVAVGPHLPQAAEQLGVSFPIANEIHAKAVFKDPLNLVPESMPFTIWSDNVVIPWSEAERAAIAGQAGAEWGFALGEILGGVHMRPMTAAERPASDDLSVRKFVGIWTFDITQIPGKPVYPIPFKRRQYRELVIRALTKLMPQLQAYHDVEHAVTLEDDEQIETQAGYYCKTRENAPLIGPVPGRAGVFLCGALTGVGVMNSQAIGELVAAHVGQHLGAGKAPALPEYARAFLVTRYADAEYLAAVEGAGLRSGQL